MLAGEKPLAMFSDIIPASFDWQEDKFDQYVKNGKLVKTVKIYNHETSQFPTKIVYYALQSEIWRIEKLDKINNEIISLRRKPTDQDDIDTGRLLGYSEQQITAFLKWTKDIKLRQEI